MPRARHTRQGIGRAEPSGHLLLLACSQRKSKEACLAPAIHLYDGVNYRVLRKFLLTHGWPPGLQVKILSAKYGLIDAMTLIEPYDQRLGKDAARKLNERVLVRLAELPVPRSVFVNLGLDYLPAVAGLKGVLPDSKVVFAPGPIGKKMQAMKEWLEELPCGTAPVRGHAQNGRAYLYFFPDWDDYIYEPFCADDSPQAEAEKVYAHELCGKRAPFDGILLSLAQMHVGKGALHRFGGNGDGPVSIRKKLRVPKRLLLFGDCGAFSYAGEATPPFTPEQAAELYEQFGFDIGASVDHIPLREVPVPQADGSVRREALSESARYRRMLLTRDNAERFLSICRDRKYGFVPLGVIQGIGTQSYVARLHEYVEMGYDHIALGGLVPRADDEILEILCAVRQALQAETRSRAQNVWLHLFGILRPGLQPMFRELGVSSFDSASYFRKAWLRSSQNYLAPDGRRWYGTLRIPISTSRAMREAADKAGIEGARLAEMEQECLDAVGAFDGTPKAKGRVTRAIGQYGPLLERKSEDNHFVDKHDMLLTDMPWERCRCPFCRSAGIHTVVFRGASRNKRRGLHNTWVFYHKVLHGDSMPTPAGGKGP